MMIVVIEGGIMPPPRNLTELLVYILCGLVPVLFGLLKKRQDRNRRDINQLQIIKRLEEQHHSKENDSTSIDDKRRPS